MESLSIPDGDLDVLAVGEALIDFISEEQCDSLKDAYTFRKYQGGSPANIAANVARLDKKAAIVAKTGIGAFGQFLKGELSRAGVSTDYLIMDHRVHTSFVFVARTSGTPDFEASRNGDFKLKAKEIEEDAIERARVVHASTFALSREPCRSAVERAFQLAQAHHKIISLDPNYSPQIWPNYQEAKEVMRKMMGYASITKPSLDDAVRLFGEGKPPEAYIELYHEMGPRVVVFTMGAKGILLSDGEDVLEVPARPVQVVDATGAGDALWAGFLVAMLDGKPLRNCALFAREIVERKLSKVGPLPATIDRQDIYEQLDP